nr:MAG TPA: hypothetical protein [Caudoviricetes sp.]
MNNKINIAEILEDCPKGMKLYSPIYGKVKLWKVNSNSVYSIMTATSIDRAGTFTSEGLLYEKYPSAECLLFPSSEMRDWTKFFKRGDVVRSIDDGAQAVFKGWESDDYTSFYASIVHHAEVDEWDEDIVFAVESFYKEYEEFARGFIVDAEEHYNGKYNPETLQVEPVKPVCPFMPFDKVLVRCGNGTWGATFFSRCDNKSTWTYVGVDCNNWEQCIPYNEQTAHLLGTTDPYTKGGSE